MDFSQNFYDAWIPKAQQNVIELKQTATTLEKSDEHISQLLYVKDSQVKKNTNRNFQEVVSAVLYQRTVYKKTGLYAFCYLNILIISDYGRLGFK